jgi:hypothetical protein
MRNLSVLKQNRWISKHQENTMSHSCTPCSLHHVVFRCMDASRVASYRAAWYTGDSPACYLGKTGLNVVRVFGCFESLMMVLYSFQASQVVSLNTSRSSASNSMTTVHLIPSNGINLCSCNCLVKYRTSPKIRGPLIFPTRKPG